MNQSNSLHTSFIDTLPHLDVWTLQQLCQDYPSDAVDRHLQLFNAAYSISMQSPDPSSKVGAVFCSQSTLYEKSRQIAECNHPIVPAMSDTRQQKLMVTLHAQDGVLHMAARMGITTKGGTLYAPWAACTGCAKSIIASGVRQLWVHKQAMERTPVRWQADIYRAFDMMAEAGVKLKAYDGPVGSCTSVIDGQTWNP